MSKEIEFVNYFGNLLDSVVEQNLPHEVSELICVKCGKRWIGVYPQGTLLKEMECPNCGQGFVIKTGQDLDAMQ